LAVLPPLQRPMPPLPWLSLAMAFGVANIYYCQALLPLMAAEWRISAATVLLLPAVSQWGLSASLLLVLPLADSLERRRLLALASGGSCLACLLLGLAAPFQLALLASALLGLCTLVPYLLPPYVAQITPRDRLGTVLGTLLAGQFSGILLSRTVSGLVAQLASWRLIYLLAAALMGLMTLLILVRLPRQQPSQPLGYLALQRSQLRLWRLHPTLRLACLRQGLLFGCFLALWSALALHLAQPPLGFGPVQIGAFGLVSLLSIAMARPIGRLVDRGGARPVLLQAGGMAVLAALLLRIGSESVPLLVLGIACLELAVQGSFVAHQTQILLLDPAARNRLLTWLVLCSYLGAALCSMLLSAVWSRWQWQGATGMGLGLTLVALLLGFGASAGGLTPREPAPTGARPAG